MSDAERLLQLAGVHPEWHDIIAEALATLEPEYLSSLLRDDDWLPGPERLLAAFRRDRDGVRYLLIGESPYPRRESANGIAFYDAAVGELWSAQGLSKAVNRATSLRNIVKTALLAEGLLHRDGDGRIPQAAIAGIDKRPLIRSLDELFANLQQAGFLLLNATPVLHPRRKPALEARYWQAFLERLLAAIAEHSGQPITLLLWGKIAQQIDAIAASAAYRKLVCEHPYNLSFIDNPQMQALFAELAPLHKR
jgi:uracil-DNA glycosylase